MIEALIIGVIITILAILIIWRINMPNNKLVFKNIICETIFTDDFQDMNKNNEINLTRQIAVIYAPNGTGKTTTVNVLKGTENSNLECTFNNISYTQTNIKELIHIIHDQNSRNIVEGETQEFFLGDNIRLEKELKTDIDTALKNILVQFKKLLKDTFYIKTQSPPIFPFFPNDIEWKKLIGTVAKSGTKDPDISLEQILNFNATIIDSTVLENIDNDKIVFISKDFSEKVSVLNIILSQLDISTQSADTPNNIHKFQKTQSAIDILIKYCDDKDCAVCDSPINPSELLENKRTQNHELSEMLDDILKKVVDWDNSKNYNDPFYNDPFNIKETILTAIKDSNHRLFNEFKESLCTHIDCVYLRIQKSLLDIIRESGIVEKYEEYKILVEQRITLTDEDQLYIQTVLENSLGLNSFYIGRDEKNNIVIKIKGAEVLGKERDKLPLSTGEQNFLSICFELLKAKNKNEAIIVIDDPISSFDSIYKNKLIYSIIKILENKKVLLFTHTMDTIRLLTHQNHKCSKMYILHNTINENNGFIEVNNKESQLLINLNELTKFFREITVDKITNMDLFMISAIPFMRGYANIIGNENIYKELSEIMHGYSTQQVDIGRIYFDLFGNSLKPSYPIMINDIITKGKDITMSADIIDNTKYPLLNQTLQHNFIYLYLRVFLENKLVNHYNIPIPTDENLNLGQIILRAFSEDTSISKKNRIILMSKKTLLNEFNHFEGNLSIFQPALDITNTVLRQEKEDIEKLLEELE